MNKKWNFFGRKLWSGLEPPPPPPPPPKSTTFLTPPLSNRCLIFWGLWLRYFGSIGLSYLTKLLHTLHTAYCFTIEQASKNAFKFVVFHSLLEIQSLTGRLICLYADGVIFSTRYGISGKGAIHPCNVLGKLLR